MTDKKEIRKDVNYWLNMGAVDLRSWDKSQERIRESLRKAMEAEILKGFESAGFSTSSSAPSEPFTLEDLQRAMDLIPDHYKPIEMVLVTKLIPPGQVLKTIYKKSLYVLVHKDDFEGIKTAFMDMPGMVIHPIAYPYNNEIFRIPVREDETLAIKILFDIIERTAKKKGTNAIYTNSGS